MNKKICLYRMTKTLARRYFRGYVNDPNLFLDDQEYSPYVYDEQKVDSVVERYQKMGRVYFAVMLDNEPIGDIVLKNIDNSKKHCTLSISIKSDEYKNRGFGTQAEILALQHAFNKMGMETVFADALIKNLRSQHVLMKVGFVETSQDDSFVYYRCDKDTWLDKMRP